MCLRRGNQHRHYTCFITSPGWRNRGCRLSAWCPRLLSCSALSAAPRGRYRPQLGGVGWPGPPSRLNRAQSQIRFSAPPSACLWLAPSPCGPVGLSTWGSPPCPLPPTLLSPMACTDASTPSFKVAFWEPSFPTPSKKLRPYKPPLVVFFLHNSDTLSAHLRNARLSKWTTDFWRAGCILTHYCNPSSCHTAWGLGPRWISSNICWMVK